MKTVLLTIFYLQGPLLPLCFLFYNLTVKTQTICHSFTKSRHDWRCSHGVWYSPWSLHQQVGLDWSSNNMLRVFVMAVSGYHFLCGSHWSSMPTSIHLLKITKWLLFDHCSFHYHLKYLNLEKLVLPSSPVQLSQRAVGKRGTINVFPLPICSLVSAREVLSQACWDLFLRGSIMHT